VQPVRGAHGRQRPACPGSGCFPACRFACAAGPPPVTPDLPSLSFPSSLRLVDVLVQGGGPAGVAPGAGLVDLKVAGADGATTLGQVLAALQLADAARDRFNLRVLNISLGAPADDPASAPLTEAVERLWADGITVVAASGNEGGGTEAPGLDPYVLTVGAVDGAGAVPAWSSRGTDFAGRAKPDLVAPGVGLVGLRAPGSTIDLANPSARVGDHYFRGSGTSMSTAVVAGAAALVAAEHRTGDRTASRRP
jgi:serine protease AprX